MNQNFLALSYKLAAEALFLFVLAGLLYFVAELVLPGFFSSRINFSALYSGLIVLVSIIGFLGSALVVSEKSETARPTLGIAFGFGILIALSLFFDLHNPWSPRNLLLFVSIIPAIGFLSWAILDQSRA